MLPVIPEALAFDDVSLEPRCSEVVPADTNLRCWVSRELQLEIPLLSAAMNTVTENAMAIAVAQVGGLGVVHRCLSIEHQVAEVRRVKRFESDMMITNPIATRPDSTLAEIRALMSKHAISGVPVVETPAGGGGSGTGSMGKLVGIITNRDIRFIDDDQLLVRDLMTCSGLIKVRPGIGQNEAKRLLHQHRIEKLLVVDDHGHCVGLITVKDIEKAEQFPRASKDTQGRLRVAAALGCGQEHLARARALCEAEVDLLVIDTAHGHSVQVSQSVRKLRQEFPEVQLMAGNIVTPEGAQELIDAGADAIKLGVGPGSICTTRIVSGVGIPQLGAILQVAPICRRAGVPLIADGGIRYSGDLVKALAAGADCVMVGSLLAGTDESPGETILYQGRSYKRYCGMGSLGMMGNANSASRYLQGDGESKPIPEGIEGRVPYKGSVFEVIHQLTGGLRTAMGYTGCVDIPALRANARFVRVSGAGLRESHVHDVQITEEAPNYHLRFEL